MKNVEFVEVSEKKQLSSWIAENWISFFNLVLILAALLIAYGREAEKKITFQDLEKHVKERCFSKVEGAALQANTRYLQREIDRANLDLERLRKQLESKK